jgi:hypothetical protein
MCQRVLWTAPSLRTTSSLNIGYVLMMFSRPFRLHPLHPVLARPQVLRFCAQIGYLSRSSCHGSHRKPTSAPHGIFVRDNQTLSHTSAAPMTQNFSRDFIGILLWIAPR